MTYLQLTKKMERLEKELWEVKRSLIRQSPPKRKKTGDVWQKTSGIISPKRAQAMLRSIEKQRKNADRF